MGDESDTTANRLTGNTEIVRMYTWRSLQGSGELRFILGPCVGVSIYHAPSQQILMGHFPLASQPTGHKLLEEFLSAAQQVTVAQGEDLHVWVGGAMNSPANDVNTDTDRQATLEAIGQMLPTASVVVRWQDTPDYFTDYTIVAASGQETIIEGPSGIE